MGCAGCLCQAGSVLLVPNNKIVSLKQNALHVWFYYRERTNCARLHRLHWWLRKWVMSLVVRSRPRSRANGSGHTEATAKLFHSHHDKWRPCRLLPRRSDDQSAGLGAVYVQFPRCMQIKLVRSNRLVAYDSARADLHVSTDSAEVVEARVQLCHQTADAHLTEVEPDEPQVGQTWYWHRPRSVTEVTIEDVWVRGDVVWGALVSFVQADTTRYTRVVARDELSQTDTRSEQPRPCVGWDADTGTWPLLPAGPLGSQQSVPQVATGRVSDGGGDGDQRKGASVRRGSAAAGRDGAKQIAAARSSRLQLDPAPADRDRGTSIHKLPGGHVSVRSSGAHRLGQLGAAVPGDTAA